MLKLFIEQQSEENIFSEVFRRRPNTETIDTIRQIRLKIREQQTEANAQPIAAIIQDVGKLKGQFRLVIVSATSEKLIRRVLEKHGIGDFTYVFGRNSNRADQEWREVETKARLFIRLSSMFGIPLERMAFVGDSDGDY